MKKLNKMKNVINLVLCFAMLISVIQISPQNVYAAKKIKLSKTKVILYVGENYCLDLYDGKSQVLDLKWKSSNKNVAKVNEIGNIKALKKGKAKITVKYKNKKYVCNVIVKDALKNHVSYELIDIPENAYSGQYNKMIKIVNNNDVTVNVNISIKQYDKDGFYIRQNTNDYIVNKNTYIIALMEYDKGLIDFNNPIQYDEQLKISLNSVRKTDSIDIEYNISDSYIDNGWIYRDIVFTSPTVKSAKYSALCYNSSGELTRVVTGYVYVPANEKVKKKDGYNLNFKDKYDIQKINIYFY